MNSSQKKPSRPEPLDLREVGAPIDGKAQLSETRLFFQLHVFSQCYRPDVFIDHIQQSNYKPPGAIFYDDLNNSTGIGVLLIAPNPESLMQQSLVLKDMQLKFDREISYRPEMTMIGRTYSSGREPSLEEWLINKPIKNVFNPKFPWAIWYPLRRKPEFYQLEQRERGRILGEHARLGRSYAAGGYASDIRLACFGLDTNDNEFLIGLVGPELYPLSRLIQDMRQTEQTTKYIESLGPFFIGKVRKRWGNESYIKNQR